MTQDFESELDDTLETIDTDTETGDQDDQDTEDTFEEEADESEDEAEESEEDIVGDLEDTFAAPSVKTSDKASGLYGNIKQAFEKGDTESVNKMLANASPSILKEIRSNSKYSKYLEDKIDWGDPKESQDDISDMDAKMEKKYSELRMKEEAEKEAKEELADVKDSINSIFKNSPEFKTENGKEFIDRVKENMKDGDSPRKAFKAVLGEYALEGKYVPQEALDQARKEGSRTAGQKARKSSTSPTKSVSSEEQEYQKAFASVF